MNNTQLWEMGHKAAKQATKLHHDLGQWDLFSRTFGFFQWKRKNALSDEQIEIFRKGFIGEALKQ